ncbi:hypothetical protein D7Y27_03095 [Corallococcus sp. AB004]|uniref:hypothetical protein n=1 Tax=Corallococcus TaxID=83461 RepID=UPI000EA25983|nr:MULTISPECIES: hypothetical protein [Corallococcus]RKI49411.1 hypothetical protein D7Y27_03095 [Corallococcus sp. AB004]NPC68869.1 hypothetical protein [Corallococcus exiguus]NPD26891.1 hypothetical protein [Corallococcus exiguus]NRD47489.1 hypothetical protein [Corallococcus exiguus]RKI03852.1 hypothetical protein D7Y04_02510 [Corallococcus sp. AB038B]
MSEGETDVVLYVEEAGQAEVEVALRECLGPAFLDPNTPHVCGLHLMVLDLTQAFAYTRAFMQEHGLKDEWFFEEFDMSRFNVVVRLFGDNRSITRLDSVLGDGIARFLSERLSQRVFILLDGGEIPFRLYEHGEIRRDYTETYREYFADSPWVPRTL